MRIFDNEKMVELIVDPDTDKTIKFSYGSYYASLKAFYVDDVDAFLKDIETSAGEMIVHPINLKEEINCAIIEYFERHPDDELPLDGDVFFSDEDGHWAQYAHYDDYKCMMTVTSEGMDFCWL